MIDVEITPEPEPHEAAALIVALGQVLADEGAFEAPAAYHSRWRRAGLREPELDE